jgi:hypothetical protein
VRLRNVLSECAILLILEGVYGGGSRPVKTSFLGIFQFATARATSPCGACDLTFYSLAAIDFLVLFSSLSFSVFMPILTTFHAFKFFSHRI